MNLLLHLARVLGIFTITSTVLPPAVRIFYQPDILARDCGVGDFATPATRSRHCVSVYTAPPPPPRPCRFVINNIFNARLTEVSVSSSCHSCTWHGPHTNSSGEGSGASRCGKGLDPCARCGYRENSPWTRTFHTTCLPSPSPLSPRPS
jgi:hypothetical protein